MGLRLGEALQLEAGDIDGERHRIHIRDGKGGKDRYVPLSDLTLKTLRKFWKTHRHPHLLFPSPNGGDSAVRLAYAYATQLLELGVDLREIQMILGHSRPGTTARYAHLTEVTSDRASSRIGELLATFQLRWEETS